MPFTHQSRNPGELIRSTDWNTMGGEVERLGGAKVDRAGNDTITGALGIRGDLSVGAANSGATLRVLKRQEDGGDPAHGALVLGSDSDASASLRLGYSSQFSWLQGLGRQTLSLNPRGGNVGVGTDRPGSRLAVAGGLSVGAAYAAGQAAPANALIVEGNAGIGTAAPQDRLEVRGALRILSDSNPLRFTGEWSGFPDAATNQAEICNDTAGRKKLMIVGNRSGEGNVRRVGVWDELAVHGNLLVDSDIQLAASKKISAPGRLHISGDESLYLLNKSGVIISKAWSGNGNLSVEGNVAFGTQTRQMLNLWNADYGAGVQHSTLYFRTGANFAWFRGGSHNDGEFNAGGGTALMVLRSDGNAGIGTASPQDRLDVRGNIRLSPDGSLFAAGAQENLRLIRGVVQPSGGIDSGAGFSVWHRGPGMYEVTFSAAFAGRPAVSVTQVYPDPGNFGPGGDTRDNAIITGIDKNRFQVSTGGGDGVRGDRWFSFIVMGPR